MPTTLTVSLKGAPTDANESVLPNGVSILDLSLSSSAPAQTGLIVRDVSSAGGFTGLEGPGVSVAEASLLVFRTNAPVEVELTQVGSPDTVQTVKVKRLLIVEFDDVAPLKLLRMKGVAKIEYFASGQK